MSAVIRRPLQYHTNGGGQCSQQRGRDETRGGGWKRRRVESRGSEGERRTFAAAELHQGPF